MIRPLKIGLLACCGILLAASQSPQTTDIAGARANVSNETIEGPFVVPQFATLYQQLGAQLPPVTSMMLSIGVNAKHYFLPSLVVLGAIAFFLWRWMKSDRGATKMDRLKLKVPMLGDVWLKYQVAVFARMLSTLLSGGLSLVPSLETACESMQSRLI